MSAPSLFDPDPTPEPSSAVEPSAAAIDDSRRAVSETRSLYRKYRPQTFGDEDLVGQEPIVRTLRNAIRLNRIAHAYLFCGPRGTGKTTTARLLAKAVNCLAADPDRRPCNACANCRAVMTGATTDIVEIDAASNRGIDDIRELRERVRYAPAQLRVKVYIVDEAHQITGPAANAFLKTLEEPPAHAKFILATTDPEELLPTIVSRCQRFDFRRIGLPAMVQRLRTVAEAESIRVTDEALTVIARHATGSLRDALGLLDQLVLYREDADLGDGREDPPAIAADAVRALLGVSHNDRVETLIAALADRDAGKALGAVNTAVEAGEDPRQINRQLVAYLRVLLHQRAGGSPDADDRARALADRFELAELAQLARRFGEIDYKIKHSTHGQLPLEVALVEGVLRGGPVTGGDPTAAADAVRSGGEDSPAQTLAPRPTAGAVDDAPPSLPHPAMPSLRDRVRGTTNGLVAAPPRTDLDPRPLPTKSPLTTVDGNVGANGASTTGHEAGAVGEGVIANGNGSRPIESVGEPLSVERLVDLWPRIRQDVKAVNRRIEALLSSIDPAAVDGDRITLSAAYEFHRDKLNTDEVRAVVEEAIGRLTGRAVRVRCLLRGEAIGVASRPTPPPAVEANQVEPVVRMAPPSVDAPSLDPQDGSGGFDAEDLDADERRLRAAKNIFDAEEIPPTE